MLASGAMTSTPGVIMSFSCISLLLLQPVPCARVAASRAETPRTPHGAAGVARASAAPHERLALSSASFIPSGSAARDRAGVLGLEPVGHPREGSPTFSD